MPGDALSGKLDLIKAAQPELGNDISPLSLAVTSVGSDIVRIKIGDPDSKRWEVPSGLFPARPSEAPVAWHVHHVCSHCLIAPQQAFDH